MDRYRKYLSKLLYNFGFLLKINRASTSSFVDIKNALIILKENNDIDSYSKFLYKISRLKFKHLKFIGIGGSKASTQTHTLILKDNQLCFEKIFDVESIEFKFLKENYTQYYNLLKEKGIRIPALYEIYEMEHIAICHFEYFEKLEPLTTNWMPVVSDHLKTFLELPFQSLQFSKPYTELTLMRFLPKLFLEFSKDVDALKAFIQVRDFVERSSFVFTHGDFYKNNVFLNVVLDWDEMGFYPFGIDWVVAIQNDGFFNENEWTLSNLLEKLDAYDLNHSQKVNIAYFALIIEAYRGSFDKKSRFNWMQLLSKFLNEEN